jgi:hypothetical protein
MDIRFLQKTVLIVFVLLFSISELFPPWLYEDGWNSDERSAGYHFIVAQKPEVKSYPEMLQIFSIPQNEPEHGFSVRKDTLSLYEQRFSITFLMLGLLSILDGRKRLIRILFGAVCIFIGAGFLGLVINFVRL